MVDLHKPLGMKTRDPKAGGWLMFALGSLGVGLLSLAAYFFIDARQSSKTIIAINDSPSKIAPPVDSSASSEQPNITLGENTDGNEPFDITRAKPLSPLLPLEGEEPAAPIPAFKPKPLPQQQRSEWMPFPDLVEKSKFGLLPKISDGGIRPLDAYSLSSGVTGANRVAIILGGLGLSQTGTQSAINALPSTISLGFSPFGNSLQRWTQLARKQGHEVVLQLPMEPHGYPAINPGPRTLTSSATPGENLTNLRWALGPNDQLSFGDELSGCRPDPQTCNFASPAGRNTQSGPWLYRRRLRHGQHCNSTGGVVLDYPMPKVQ